MESTAAPDLATRDPAELAMSVCQRDATADRYRKTYFAVIERRRRRAVSRTSQLTAQRRLRSGPGRFSVPTNAVARLTVASTLARNPVIHRTRRRLIARALPMSSLAVPVARRPLARFRTALEKLARTAFPTVTRLVSSLLVAATSVSSYATREIVSLA